MKKKLRKIFQIIFSIIHPLLKPVWVQNFLIWLGVRIPYHGFTEKLNYRGLITFEINGQKITLQSNNQPIDIFIFWYGIFGVWEPTQVRLWANLVKEADVILDIGANTGVYSLIAETNKNAQVFAFEPVPVVREMLQKNLDLNKSENITIIPSLVGSSDGEQMLYIPRQGWVDVASIEKDFAEQYLEKEPMEELVCPITTIDTFLSEHVVSNQNSILCKIDVEGAEHHVLEGMQQTLKNRNITFTVELLDEKYFKKVTKLIPTEYKVFAIDEKKKEVYETVLFVDGATNYLISKRKMQL